MNISFSKYQATGNDFILIDGLTNEINISAEQVSNLCNRHFGIGADGLIIAKRSETADLFMDLNNSDGSKAELSGNGIRALAAFVIEKNLISEAQSVEIGLPTASSRDCILIETMAGIKNITVANGLYSVDMGKPSFDNASIGFDSDKPMWRYPLEVDGQTIEVYGASMGNPHCIIFIDNIENAHLEELGARIENHPLFKNRINVEWVQVVSDEMLAIKVWERGVGATKACGTGSCASFAVANRLGFVKKLANISLPGGQVQVELADENLFLSGEARLVFKGSIDLV